MASLKVLVYEVENIPAGSWNPVVRCLCGNKEGDTPIGQRLGEAREFIAGDNFRLNTSFGFAYEQTFADIRFEVLHAETRELIAFGILNDIGKYVNAERDSCQNIRVPMEPCGDLKIGLQLFKFPIDRNRPDRCDVHISMLTDCNHIPANEELRAIVKLDTTTFESSPVMGERVGDKNVHRISQKFRFPYKLQRECEIVIMNGGTIVGRAVLDVWELLTRWRHPSVSHSGVTPLVDGQHRIVANLVAGVELWDASGCAARINRHLGPLEALKLRMEAIQQLNAECVQKFPEDKPIEERVHQSEEGLAGAVVGVEECNNLAAEALLDERLSKSGVATAETELKRRIRRVEEDINKASVESLTAFRMGVQKEWVVGMAAKAQVDKNCTTCLQGLKDVPASPKLNELLASVEKTELAGAKYSEQLDRALNASKTIVLPAVAVATLDEALLSRIELEKLQVESERLSLLAIELIKTWRLERRRADIAGLNNQEPMIEDSLPLTPCCWMCYC